MSIRKTIIVSLLSNVLVVAALLGAFAWTQSAQANTSEAPGGPLIGPFFYSLSSSDFNSLDDNVYGFGRGACGMFRTGASPSPAFAIAPIHLPTGAQLSELLIDTCDPGNGSVSVSVRTCDIGRGACDDHGTAVSLDGGRTQRTIPLDLTVNNSNGALILLATFTGGDNVGDIALWFARVAYYVPAATFLPLIRR